MKTSSRAGKPLLLALLSVSISACGNGPLAASKQADRASIQSAVHDPQAQAFYQARQWKDAWDKKSEKQLLEIIAGAPANGLKPELFVPGELPKDPAEREAALTSAALNYASALARGYADPAKLTDIYTIPRPKLDVARGLAGALGKGDLAGWYASLVPQTDEYRALSRAHLDYLRSAAKGQYQPVPDGDPIKPGAHDARMPAIVAALHSAGHMASAQAAGAPKPTTRYSPQLVAAVKALQAEFGLKTDGIIGGDTLDALNAGPGYRARQTAIAMERLRWLERDPAKTRIDVNTASATLDFWRGGEHVDRRKVVVGEPDKQTPQIQAPIFRLVANPTWTVPKSIAGSELAQKSQAWLDQNNFQIKDGYYVQQPGPKNSLGLVKFDMDDKYAIYLHDTPAKALFGVPDRHRSHGCVRVDNALQFAANIAQQQGVLDAFNKGRASGDESFVKLKQSIPVRLYYHTAFVDGHGIQFRPDYYELDNNVARALRLEPGPIRKPQKAQGEDIGP